LINIVLTIWTIVSQLFAIYGRIKAENKLV
jgi:hypothetical protein